MSIHERKIKKGTRYDVKIRRPDGSQYQRTFASKREALAFESTQLVDQRRGVWTDDRLSQTLFSVYADQWLSSNPTKRTKTTLRDAGIVKNHLDPALGERAISEIKHSELRTLINNWTKSGLSPSSIRRHKAVMSAIFRMAIRDGLIVQNPVEGLMTPRVEPSQGRALSADEALRLLSSVEPKYQALIYILLTTGLRWSEVAGLEIRHFKTLSTSPHLLVEQGLHETKDGHELTPPKSAASHRRIPLTAEQVQVISGYIELTNRTGAQLNDPLFVSPKGKHLAYTNFRPRIWEPAVKEAGLEGLRIHDLRKTAITNLLLAGIDVKTITVLVGHEDLRTTLQHYAKASSQSLLGASQALVEAVDIRRFSEEKEIIKDNAVK